MLLRVSQSLGGKARVWSQIAWASSSNHCPALPLSSCKPTVTGRPFDSPSCIFQASSLQPSSFCLGHFSSQTISALLNHAGGAAGNSALAHYTVFPPRVWHDFRTTCFHHCLWPKRRRREPQACWTDFACCVLASECGQQESSRACACFLLWNSSECWTGFSRTSAQLIFCSLLLFLSLFLIFFFNF